MAQFVYTGQMTDAQRRQFAASLNAQLVVVPHEPGIAASGLMSDREIPVSVNASDGEFRVSLESSRSVRPLMMYDLRLIWQEGGMNRWSTWRQFFAAEGGGPIADMAQIPPNPGTWTYGWGLPETNGVTRGLYVDLETGQWYGQEGAII